MLTICRYFLIGLPVLTPHLLEQIPSGALNGVLTFVGVAGLFDCQLWERLQCLLKLPSAFNPRYAGLDWTKVHFFTFLQVLFLVLFWLANIYVSFFVVPVLLCTTVAVRRYVMPTWFTEEELAQVRQHALSSAFTLPSALVAALALCCSGRLIELKRMCVRTCLLCLCALTVRL